MTLPTHRPDAVCPKCGEAEVGTSYQRVGREYECLEPTRIGCERLGAGRVDCGSFRCNGSCLEEHLHRTCSRCRFTWPEAVVSPAGVSA